MRNVSENMNKYGEKMTGKFSHNPSKDGIVISVISPFDEEIHMDCDNDIYQEYRNTYSLLEPQADHPDNERYDRLFYYNTQEKLYYRAEWGPTEESGWGRIWFKTDILYIRKHAIRYEKLQAHFRRYREIHKGQLCVFIGYAVDPNRQPKRPSTVESMRDRHEWLYDPFSFDVAPLDENTIDDFVEETPISKEMTNKMVLYHQEQDRVRQQKEDDDKKKKKKEKVEVFFGNINAHIGKYEKIYRYAVVGGILGLIITILQIMF